MRTRPRNVGTLLALVIVATALTWLMSRNALARSTFQSPGPFESGLPSATAQSPTPVGPELRTPTVPPTSTPVIPTATLVPTVVATATTIPTVSDFLPPPTLTSRDVVTQSQSFPGLPESWQSAASPTALSSEGPPESQGIPGNSLSLAKLMDAGVTALSYVWLCCGVFVLAAIIVILVLLMRRSRRQ